MDETDAEKMIDSNKQQSSNIRKAGLALIVVVLIVSAIGLYVVLSVTPRKDLSDYKQIIEPSAPLSQNTKLQSIATSSKDSTAQTISSAAVSEVKQSTVTDSSLVLSESKGAFSLGISDADGNIKKSIKTEGVIDAEFQDKSTVSYQIVNANDAGVYLYNTDKNTNELIVKSDDPQVFNNVGLIDNSRFFFAQPKTGTIGFGKIGTSDTTVLSQKMLKTQSNYSQVGAYKYVSVSPDKKYVAFYDLTPVDNNITLSVLPVTAKSLTDMYYQVKVPGYVNQTRSIDKVISWSKDSKYIVTGNNATIIDVAAKNVAYSLKDKIASALLSPNLDKFIVFNDTDNKVFIRNFKTNDEVQVGQDVGDAKWLTNDYVILTIGQKLYLFNVKDSKLETVTETRAVFSILSVDAVNGTAFVKQGDVVIKVKVSN